MFRKSPNQNPVTAGLRAARDVSLSASVRVRMLPSTIREIAPRMNPVPEAVKSLVTAFRPVVFAMLCVLVALAAVLSISILLPGVAEAQVGELTGAIDRAKDDVVTIGLSLAVLVLAVGAIMVMWPSSNERTKGMGMKVLVSGAVGMVLLLMIAAVSGMIEGWGGGGGGGGN